MIVGLQVNGDYFTANLYYRSIRIAPWNPNTFLCCYYMYKGFGLGSLELLGQVLVANIMNAFLLNVIEN